LQCFSIGFEAYEFLPKLKFFTANCRDENPMKRPSKNQSFQPQLAKPNPTRNRRRRLIGFELLEDRRLLALVTWDGGGGDDRWETPANWLGDVLPGAGDDVSIDVADSTRTIVIDASNVNIRSLNSQENLAVSGTGNLTIDSGVQAGVTSIISGGLFISPSRGLIAQGLGTTVVFVGNTNVDGASIYALKGASLALPGLINFKNVQVDSFASNLWASGAGSQLDLRNLKTIEGSPNAFSQFRVQALEGGSVDMRSLVSATDVEGGDTNARSFIFRASGANSKLDLSSLSSIVDRSNFTSNPDSWAGYSRIDAAVEGTVIAPNLVTITSTRITIDATGIFALPALTSAMSSRFEISSTTAIPLLSNINGASLYVSGGGTLSLPSVTSYVHALGYTGTSFLRASGNGSVLDLRNLTTISGSNQLYTTLSIEALSGGKVDMRSLTTVTDVADGDPNGRATRFKADGSNSQIDISALTTIVDRTGFTNNGVWPGYSALIASNNGTILAPVLNSVAGTEINIDATGTINVPLLASATGGILTFTTIQSLPLLANASLSSISVSYAGQTFPMLSNINGASLYFSGSGNLSLLGVTNIDGASLTVSGGGTLSLPNVTSYVHTLGYTGTPSLRASGIGSVLDLRNITTVTGSNQLYTTLSIEALSGGKVDMRSLTTVTDVADGDPNGRATRFKADGSNSQIDISALTTIVDRTSFTNNGNWPGYSALIASNNGTILAPALNSVSGTEINIDATGKLNVPLLASATDGILNFSTFQSLPLIANASSSTISVSHASQTFPLLSNINGASLYVSGGGTLSLPSVTGYVYTLERGSTAVLRATGSGSELDLKNLISITGSNQRYTTLYVEALNGGTVDMRSMETVTDPVNGGNWGQATEFKADGANSQIDLSTLKTIVDLTGYSDNSWPGYSALIAENNGTILAPVLNSISGTQITVDATATMTMSSQALTAIGSRISISGAAFPRPLVLRDGSYFSGSGSITGATAVSNSTVEPLGNLVINGNFSLDDSSQILINVGYQSPSPLFGSLVVNGDAVLDGTILLNRINNYNPPINSVIRPIEYTSVDGTPKFAGTDFGGNTEFVPSVTSSGIDFTAKFATGPSILSATFLPTGTDTYLILNFSEPIRGNSISIDDIDARPVGGSRLILDEIRFADSTSRRVIARFTERLLPNGQYRIAIGPDILDSAGNPMNQDGDGSNGEPADDVFVAELTLLRKPDLSLSSIDSPSRAQPGSTIPISWTTINTGGELPASPFAEYVFLSDDESIGNDRLIGQFTFTTAGTRNVNVTIPTTGLGSSGSVRFVVVTDANSVIDELSETNNALLSGPVLVATPADLVVSDIVAKPLVVAGQPLIVSWTLNNHGPGPATGTWTDRVYLSDDPNIGNDQLVGSFPVTISIDPDRSIVRTQQIQIPNNLSGVFYLVVSTDTDNTIIEFENENNNTSIDNVSLTIDSRPSPNLTIESVANLTSGLSSGQLATVQWVVSNVGNSSTDSFGWADRVYLSIDGVFDDSDLYLGQSLNPSYLNAGESYSSSLTARIPDEVFGDRYFIVVTDALNQMSETGGEEDNVRIGLRSNIAKSPVPNLFITSVGTPADGFEGQTIEVTWTVQNQGEASTSVSSWTDQVYLSLNGSDIDPTDIFLTTYAHTGSLARQGSYTVSRLPVLLPENINATNARIIIRTDANKKVYEGLGEADNDLASSIPLSIFLRDRPNLVATSIAPRGNAYAGQPITVAYTVENTSPIDTRQNTWVNAVYLSTDRTLETNSDVLIGQSRRDGILSGGKSESLTSTFVLPDTLQGLYYLIVVTDFGNNVRETDETDNVIATQSPITIRVDPPDLTVTAVSTTGPLNAGREIGVRYTVKNIGNNPTPNTVWQDAVYWSADSRLDANDTLLSQRERSGVLIPNQAENRSVNLRLPGDLPRDGFLIVQSDSTDFVYELNQDNNIKSLSIRVGDERPDLHVVSFVPNLGGNVLAPGGSIPVDFKIENQGAGPTFGRTWSDRIVLSSDLIVGNSDDVSLGTYTSPDLLNAGATYDKVGENIRLPKNTPAGLYRLFLITDVVGAVPEVDETNNSMVSAEFQVSTTSTTGITYDLLPTNLTVPATALSGTVLSVSWSVKNNNTFAIPAIQWTDTVWLSQDSIIDGTDILIGQVNHYGGLNASASYTGKVDWPIGTDISGTYNVIVQTDSESDIPEGGGEANNNLVSANTVSISLAPSPDLKVGNLSVPSTAISGRTINLGWTIDNIGDANATGQWTDSLYLSLDQIFDPLTDIPVGFVDQNRTLVPDQSYVGNTLASLPIGIGGDYFVIVITDSTDRVFERRRERNNISASATAISITHVPAADLVVGNITIPASSVLGQSASITYTITNNSNNIARGGWYDSVYLSTDDKWDITDGYLGRVFRSGDVAANTSYTTTLTAPLPGVLPGNYKAIVRTDIRNNLVEADETNNLKATLDSFTTDAPALTLGTPKAGTIRSDEALYYKVTVPAGETVVIEFDSSQTSGMIELYASFQNMPSRSTSDFTAIRPSQPDQRIVISSTTAGTYYILAYGANVENGTSDFNILARIVPFSAFSTNFGQGGTAGNRTILVEGAKLDRTVSASLVDTLGRSFQAVSYYRVSDTRLYVTFDLRSVATGSYSVRLTKGSTGESLSIADSLQVVFATSSISPITLSRPDTFNRRRNDRPPAIIPVTLSWRNDTLNDISVPLIHFSATDPFGLTLEDAKAARTTDAYEFLGLSESDGPRDILLSGETSSANFYVKPLQVAADSPPRNIHYVAEYFYNEPMASYTWDFELSQLDLSYLTDDEAIAAIKAFKLDVVDSVGSLRSAFVDALHRNGPAVPSEIRVASRYLLQDVLDRFVATRFTSVLGSLDSREIALNFANLVVTLKSTTTPATYYSAQVLADGSFVLPKLAAGEYEVTISGGAAKAPDGYRIVLTTGQHLVTAIPLATGPFVVAATVHPRMPVGISPIQSPWITRPGQIGELIAGNVLDSVLTQLNGIDYRVELIGDAPAGFALDALGNYRFTSSESQAIVVHYDLVLPDTVSRVGRLLELEIRSRGVIAITLKNNFTGDVRSQDPNDIIGPNGYGPEKWVSVNDRLPYKIRFENDPRSATTAASFVEVSQVLDSDLDLNSVQFQEFGFGGTTYNVAPGRQSINTTIDLRVDRQILVRVFAFLDFASRKITWRFSTIAPETGQDIAESDLGFLPLNQAPPIGDGYVAYSVKPKRNAATGAKIDASARIVFDGNRAIDTPTIFNTIDAYVPSSTITTAQDLPSESKVLVNWSGEDGAAGAGLAAYDVYVSKNGGRYLPWLVGTKLVSAVYPKSLSSTYDFVTLANDHVGNRESDAKIPVASRPTAFAGGPYIVDEGLAVKLSGIGADPTAGQILQYEWDFDYDGVNFQVDSTTQQPIWTSSDGPAKHVVALRVKDSRTDALYSDVSTATITVHNVAPNLTVNSPSILGNAGATVQQAGTWNDVPNDGVYLTASLGTVIANADGTWNWTYTPLSSPFSEVVTITATDKDGAETSVSFTLNVILALENDFGDAPTAVLSGFANSYPTTLADNGARHKVGNLRLGTLIDVDGDGVPSADGKGDDNSGQNDEDGIVFGMSLIASAAQANVASLTATASGAGKLDGWIDFNRDGDWNDPRERIFASMNVVAGANLLAFTIPANAAYGATYARFRLSTVGGLAPTGTASDGEVEDYRINVFNAADVPDLVLNAAVVGEHDLTIESGKLIVRSSGMTILQTNATEVRSVRLLSADQSTIYAFANPKSSVFGTVQYRSASRSVRVIVTQAAVPISLLGSFGITEIDLSNPLPQTLEYSADAIANLNQSKTLRVISGEKDSLIDTGGWKQDLTRVENGKIWHRFIRNQSYLDVQNARSWQNPTNSMDADGSGDVSPLDVLVIINQINSSIGGQSQLPDFDPQAPNDFRFLDIDGDGTLSPLDVLTVINFINARSGSFGEGEASLPETRADAQPQPSQMQTRNLGEDLLWSDLSWLWTESKQKGRRK
jgi:GEVED domain/CARDB/Dockerin type I domain/Bacterial pre-peptidase C-terminal domain